MTEYTQMAERIKYVVCKIILIYNQTECTIELFTSHSE